jgi:hypothetical protein
VFGTKDSLQPDRTARHDAHGWWRLGRSSWLQPRIRAGAEQLLHPVIATAQSREYRCTAIFILGHRGSIPVSPM